MELPDDKITGKLPDDKLPANCRTMNVVSLVARQACSTRTAI